MAIIRRMPILYFRHCFLNVALDLRMYKMRQNGKCGCIKFALKLRYSVIFYVVIIMSDSIGEKYKYVLDNRYL